MRVTVEEVQTHRWKTELDSDDIEFILIEVFRKNAGIPADATPTLRWGSGQLPSVTISYEKVQTNVPQPAEVRD